MSSSIITIHFWYTRVVLRQIEVNSLCLAVSKFGILLTTFELLCWVTALYISPESSAYFSSIAWPYLYWFFHKFETCATLTWFFLPGPPNTINIYKEEDQLTLTKYLKLKFSFPCECNYKCDEVLTKFAISWSENGSCIFLNREDSSGCL